ncbi:MAG: DNA replication/repair protein RecF [Alphaproteobacteria bacterium]
MITALQFNYFRSYIEFSLLTPNAAAVVITGANGMGKTNILEGISLFSPGKGLRNASLAEFEHHSYQRPNQPPTGWGIQAHIQVNGQDLEVKTGIQAGGGRRRLIINDKENASLGQLAHSVPICWITPAMDRLFVEPASVRRRFFDRLCFHLNPDHASQMARYEHAMKERAALLENSQYEPFWLEGLERVMVENTIALAGTRLQLAHLLQQHMLAEDDSFPLPEIKLHGMAENLLQECPAIEAEQQLMAKLKQQRSQQYLPLAGPQRADWQITYQQKKMKAEQCSTGEQKALLLSMMLAHARMLKHTRKTPPILLLDEVAAHFDAKRRASALQQFMALAMQIWLTGVDEQDFAALRGNAQFVKLGYVEVPDQVILSSAM